MAVPAELGPSVFLPDPLRLAYWRAGQAAYARGAAQQTAILAGLEAAAALPVQQSSTTHDAEGATP